MIAIYVVLGLAALELAAACFMDACYGLDRPAPNEGGPSELFFASWSAGAAEKAPDAFSSDAIAKRKQD